MALAVSAIGSGTTISSVTTVASTLTGAAAVGDLVVVIAAAGGGNHTGVTDSKGNTYSLARTETSAFGFRGSMYYTVVTSALASGDTVTVAMGTLQNRQAIQVILVTGAATTSPLDQVASVAGSSVTTWDAGTTATTTQADELVLAMFASTAHTTTPGSGYTFLAEVDTGSTGPIRVRGMYRIVSATGTQHPTATGAFDSPAGITATFKAGGPPPLTRVTATRDLRYQLLGRVTAQRDLRYQVRGGVSAERELQYAVLGFPVTVMGGGISIYR